MKIRNNLYLCGLLNIVCFLFVVIITGFYYLLIPVILNILFFIKTRWARLTINLYCSLIIILTALTLVYSLIKTDSINKPSLLFIALIMTIASSLYCFFVLRSKNAKVYFQPVIYLDPDIPEGWICPQCESKMLFSVRCWNCGFRKEDIFKKDVENGIRN